MRPVTRQALLVIAAVVVLLLALGALPSLLKSGDPYYLTATASDPPAGTQPLNASALDERRYPFTTAALDRASAAAAGRSDPYWRGPVGLKGAFTHSPFDERAALTGRYGNATADGAVYARHEGAVYRLTVVRAGGGDAA